MATTGDPVPTGRGPAGRIGSPDRGISRGSSNGSSRDIPVLPALHPLLSGLRRGQVVSVPGGRGAGGGRSGILPWALVAQAVREGAWCAAVALPDAGVLAAADLGMDLDRLVLVDDPGPRWADVVAAFLAAVDLVVTRPPRQIAPALSRRLAGIARQRGAVLVVAGDWAGADVRVQVVESSWVGIGSGHGRLAGRRARVEVAGRGADARSRSAWLWLPGPDGRCAAAGDPVGLAATG